MKADEETMDVMICYVFFCCTQIPHMHGMALFDNIYHDAPSVSSDTFRGYTAFRARIYIHRLYIANRISINN